MNFDGLYNIRPVNLNDKNFIIKSFLLGLYHGDSWFTRIPKRIFMDYYKHIVVALITSPKVVINVACLPDDPEVILGYAVTSTDKDTVHWVYVKEKWRKQGIMKSLLPSSFKYTTHLTSLGYAILTNKYKHVIFNPFKL